MPVQRSEGDHAKTVAQNFIRQHGRNKFVRLIEMFMANEPGPKIAHEFGVSRQRVHQWKTQLGHERVVFHLNDTVAEMLGTITAGRKLV